MIRYLLFLLLPLTLFGQSQKISDMTSATSLTGSEYVPIVQTTNKKSTVTLLRGWASTIGTAGQLMKVNAGATALEFFTPSYLTALSNGNGTTANGSAVDLGGVQSGNIDIDPAVAGTYEYRIGYTRQLSRIVGYTDFEIDFRSDNSGYTQGSSLLLQNSNSQIRAYGSGYDRRINFSNSGVILDLGSDATGDTYYRNSSGYFTRLAAGTNGHVLTLASGIPSWSAPAAGYTDEQAQDAVGAMVDASLTYVDGTPLLQRAALTGAVTATAGSNATSLGSFTVAQLSTAISDADISGTNTGDQTTITGNAGTATTLQNTRTIWGQNFNGSANVTGNLTLGNSSLLDANGNEVVTLSGVASAINEVTIQNASASGFPSIYPTGGDTDIGLAILGKGTGQVYIPGYVLIGGGSYSSGTAPAINITGNGIASTATSTGGVVINGGQSNASSASTSGSVTLTSGAAIGTNTSSGSITLSTQAPTGSGSEGAVEIQTRSTGKIGFFAATPVVKQSAVTTPQGIADVLTAYGLLPSSTVSGGGGGLTYAQVKAMKFK